MISKISHSILVTTTLLSCAFIPFAACAQDKGVPETATQIQLSFAPVVKKAAPAVVNIHTKRFVSVREPSPFMNDPFFSPFFGDNLFGRRMRKQVESALGSGVLIDPSGIVITNAHVIKDAQEITIVLNDGRELAADLTLADPRSDLALLRVKDNETKEPLPFLSLKPSESLEVGDLVIAVGNPFGVGQTVTSGIVSATGRSSLNINDFNFFIQTDAAINPGNSGGPLINLKGDIVGINTAIYSRDGGSSGIGFAIPSEMVASVVAAAEAGQSGTNGITRPWLGVTTQNVSNDIAESLGIKGTKGSLIKNLHEHSPLKEAGVRIGDIVLSVNGKEIRDAPEMKFRLATVPIGGHADVEVLRQEKRKSFKVKAISPPDKPPRNETELTGQHYLSGAIIANINPAVAMEIGVPGAGLTISQGVVVMSAPRGTAAYRVLSEGDVIIEINGRKIQDVNDVKKALKSDTALNIVINKQGRTRRIMLR